MSIDIERRTEPGDWDDVVAQSESSTPFHRETVLETIAEYSDTDCHWYVGYKGQEPVGAFPIFELQKGPISTAFSPPPDLKITYLGPATANVEKLSQRKRERRNRRFVEGCLEDLENVVGPKFFNVRTSPRLEDPRPFIWNDFDSTPRYTYVVDLERDPEDLLMAFSSDARSNVRTDDPYELTEADPETSAEVVRKIHQRHAEQDVDFDVPPAFVAALHERLPDDVFRTYVCCNDDGDLIGGLVVLSDDDVAYRWLSWADHDADLPAADLLDWRAIEDARDAGCTGYDLVGANDPRLSKFKAKFAPELRDYAALQDGSRGMTTAAGLYDKIR